MPNLVYYTTGSGQDGTPFIRGVGAYPAVFLDNGVATYVDGVFLSRIVGVAVGGLAWNTGQWLSLPFVILGLIFVRWALVDRLPASGSSAR